MNKTLIIYLVFIFYITHTYGQNLEIHHFAELIHENKLSAPHMRELFEVWKINILCIKARIRVHPGHKTELEKELEIAETLISILKNKLDEIHSD